MAPPIIMTPFQFLGSILGVPASVASYLNTITSSLQLWYQQFIQWSSSCVQTMIVAKTVPIDHTGTTTADTLLTFPVAPLKITNGTTFRIKVGYLVLVQGAPVTQLEVLLNYSGGSAILVAQANSSGATNSYFIETDLTFTGSPSSLSFSGVQTSIGSGVNPAAQTTSTVAFTIAPNSTITVQIQSGTITDHQKIAFFSIEAL